MPVRVNLYKNICVLQFNEIYCIIKIVITSEALKAYVYLNCVSGFYGPFIYGQL